jgi:hypothetical protein
MKFPEHKCGLYLTHNEHRDVYEPLEDSLRESIAIWESDEAKQRAIDSDECWELQWYPETGLSFYCVAAPTLEECLALAKHIEETQQRERYGSRTSEASSPTQKP